MKKRMIALILVLLMLTGCAKEYEAYTLQPNEFLMGTGAENFPGGEIPEGVQLTEEDIQNMNNGNARFVYSEEGYVTFLNGRFSNKKIENYEDAVGALQPVAKLIGLAAGSEFFAYTGSRGANGYTYWTFQQRYGDATVQYATLRVAVDPQGYTAGLACSFTPNIGIKTVEDGITAQQAEQIILNTFASFNLQCYSQQTTRVVLTINGVSYSAWVVYTNNPEPSAATFDLPYYEHFVSIDGKLLYSLPTAAFTGENKLLLDSANQYFEGLTQYSYTTTVTRWDGSREEITVPVAYNPNTGLYYLADIERKILADDFYAVMYQGRIGTMTSTTGKDWSNNTLLSFDRYCKVYDFYADMGLYSSDGVGTPILLLQNYCDSNGTPVDNACYAGIVAGFATFCVSEINRYSEAVDVCGHEYAHGISSSTMAGNLYANTTGAINEAISDILGNICEMMMGATTDTEWLVGENSGDAMRCMSDPMRYNQPTEVGGTYYIEETDDPDPARNDNGGVHFNNSLLSQMAYKLHEAGMTLEQQRTLWLITLEMMTPLSEYDEVYEALLMSIDTNGFDSCYKDILTEAFEEAGMLPRHGG